MLCQKIISGGQTGVDRGALDASLKLNFPCGGWCPEGRRAEDGLIDKKYPLTEFPNGNYSDRTKKNVEDADGTLIILRNKLSGGTKLTFDHAVFKNKPVLLIETEKNNAPDSFQMIKKWIVKNNIKTLNIAGPRASEWAEGYLFAKEITSKIIGFY